MLKNLSKLFSATLIVQAVSFLLMPIITRLYSPVEFGIYQFVVSFSLIVSPLITLSLGHAIIKVQDECFIDKVIQVSFWLSIYFSFTLSLIFIPFVFFLDSVKLSFWHSIALFFLLLGGGIFNLQKFLLLRSNAYGKYSILTIYLSIINNISKIALGLYSSTSLSLILSLVLGNFLSVFILRRSKNLVNLFIFERPTLHDCVFVFNRFKSFCLGLTSNKLIEIALNWHLLIIAPFFGSSSDMGVLALAFSVINTPLYPFLDSITNYGYSEATKNIRKGEKYLGILVKISILGLLISFLSTATILLFGEFLFSVVFGNDWSEASIFASLLIFPVACSFVFFPMYRILANLHELHIYLFSLDCLFLVLISVTLIFALIFGWPLLDVVKASCFWMFLSHIVKGVLVVLVRRYKISDTI